MSGFQFKFERFSAFGWLVHRKELDTGESFSVTYIGDSDVSTVNNVTMYVKGRVEVDFGGNNPNNYPGVLKAGTLPQKDYAVGNRVFPAGTTLIHTATEPSEFWCFNYEMNRRQLPVVEKVVLAPSESVPMVGRKFLLLRGTLGIDGVEHTGPVALEVTRDVVVVAMTDCYGVFISAERANEVPA
jgi:hypothetical protein